MGALRLSVFTLLLWLIIPFTVSAERISIVYEGEAHDYDNTEISVYVDGEQVVYDGMFPVIIDGRTLIPVREVLENESINAKVSWNGEEQKVTVYKDEMQLDIWVGQSTALVNGQVMSLDTKARLISIEGQTGAKTMVPIRFITEALGYEVKWNQEQQRIDLIGDGMVLIVPEDIEEPGIVERPEISATRKVLEGREIQFSLGEQDSEAPVAAEYNDDHRSDETFISLSLFYSYHDRVAFYTRGPVSDMSYIIQGQYLTIQLDNTSMGIISDSMDTNDNEYMESVSLRALSQSPPKTEIAIKMAEGVWPRRIDLNEKRDELNVIFGAKGVMAVEAGRYDDGDFLSILGEHEDLHLMRLKKPERLVVDVEDAINPFGVRTFDGFDGDFIETMTIDQFNATTTRFILETNGEQPWQIIEDEGVTHILVGASSDMESSAYHKAFTIRGYEQEDIKDIHVTYDHLDKSCNFNVPGIKPPEVEVDDEERFTLKAVSSGSFMLQGNHIYEYELRWEDGVVQAYAARPKDIYEHIVVVDVGHGGSDPGAVRGDLYEKNLNLSIAEHMMAITDGREGFRYYFTRSEDISVSYEKRCEMANDLHGDVFISLHNNAMDVERYPHHLNTRGLEPILTSNKAHSDSEDDLAQNMMDFVHVNMPEHVIRGKQVNNHLYILNNTYMPSVIIEYAYMSNGEDAAFLREKANLERLAQITVLAVENYLLN